MSVGPVVNRCGVAETAKLETSVSVLLPVPVLQQAACGSCA